MHSLMTASMKLNTNNYTQRKYCYYAFQFMRQANYIFMGFKDSSTRASDNTHLANLPLV